MYPETSWLRLQVQSIRGSGKSSHENSKTEALSCLLLAGLSMKNETLTLVGWQLRKSIGAQRELHNHEAAVEHFFPKLRFASPLRIH